MAVTKPHPRRSASVISKVSTLQTLTSAALALPGLLLAPAYAADEEVSFQYGRYQEGRRDLFGANSRFKPIQVDSLHGAATLKFSDRLTFGFNYTQDTWGGATPVATAPRAFEGNRQNDTTSSASPYIQNSALFDRSLNPVKLDLFSGRLVKDRQLVHTLSSASPETRKQGDFRLGYDWDEAALAVGGGTSVEHDYESNFGNLAGRLDFNQKLTTLNLGLSYTNSKTSALLDHDALPYIERSTFGNRVSLSDGNATIRGGRQDWASSLGLTQVLTKNSLLEASVGYTRSTGYMANPYKVVEVAFVDPAAPPGPLGELTGQMRAFLEQRPDERNQWTANLRYVLHVDPLDAAIHTNYGFYHDDWGIDAHTFEADWAQPLGAGWTVTPRIRYYSQSAADFYHPYVVSLQDATNYDPAKLPSAYSSDHRLSGYGALSGGITVSKQFAKGVGLEAGFEYYTHKGGLKLGGGGENGYANFDFFAVNAALKVDLSAVSVPSLEDDEHSIHRHHGHLHHAHRAPAGVMFDHMLTQAGDFMVGYRYMRSDQGGTMLRGSHEVTDQVLARQACGINPCYVTPRTMSMNMHMLDLMYAPTDWLNLMLMPQFVDMSMFMRPLAGVDVPNFTTPLGAAVVHAEHEHMTGGIGDTGLYALFKLLETPSHRIHATLGLSAPTGRAGIKLRNTHQQRLGFIHYGMQLGSGTWDFKPSLTYSGDEGAWSWGAQVSGTVRMEDHNDYGYAFGDTVQSTAWGSYSPLDWLSVSVRGLYTVQGSIRGAYNSTYHQIGPMDYTSSYGGRFWDVGFGVSAVVPQGSLQGNRLSFEWLEPVHDDVNGYQLPRASALSATWSYAF